MSIHSQTAGLRYGALAVSLSAILWGTVGIATQALYRQSELTPIAVGFFRLALALPLVALLCWKFVDRRNVHLGRSGYGRIALIGVMLALYQVFFFAAIGYIGVAAATLVTLCSAPVLVALLSVLVLKERFSKFTGAALLAALFGTTLLVGFPDTDTAQSHVLLGTLLALGSAGGYAIVALMGRAVAAVCPPLLSTTVSFAAGALFLLPLAAKNILVSHYSVEIWGLLLYIGVVPTAVAYTLFFFGMRSIKASTASILTLLEPLTATLLAWLIFAERLAPSGLVGAALLLAALLVLYLGETRSKG